MPVKKYKNIPTDTPSFLASLQQSERYYSRPHEADGVGLATTERGGNTEALGQVYPGY